MASHTNLHSSQSRILSRLCATVFHGSCRPDRYDLECGTLHDVAFPKHQVEQLLGSSYFDTHATQVVTLSVQSVAIPQDVGDVRLLQLLPPDIALRYASPSPLLLAAPPVILPRSIVRVARGDYAPLIRKLAAARLVTFTTSPSVVNGLFGVPKPDGTTRLIIDARPANSFFVTPPPVRLPSPESLARLIEPPAGPVFTAKSDLDNFYHRLRLPQWLTSFFALPPVSPRDVDLCDQFPLNTPIFPCFTSLPMGWSHSVFLAQVAHEWLVYSQRVLSPERALSPLSEWTSTFVFHLIYIDDVLFFGADPLMVNQHLDRYTRAIQDSGLRIKRTKLVPATSQCVNCLGFDFDGERRILRLDDLSMRRASRQTLALLRAEAVTGRLVHSVVGQWLWAMLPSRPTLSIFASTFRFIECAGTATFNLWPSVKRELRVLLAIRPLLFASLTLVPYHSLFATDASLHGFGIMRRTYAAGDFFQRNANAQCCSVDQVTLCDSAHLPALTATTSVADRSVPPFIARSLLEPWHLVFKGKWQSLEHINVLELRAVELLCSWCLSKSDCLDVKLILLSDSQVVVAGLNKGRSSSRALLPIYRRLAASTLAIGLRILPFWIRSGDNPADGASRG